MADMEEFDAWYARCHPFDWYAKENGEPVPASVRLDVWALCRAAWLREDKPQRNTPVNSPGSP